MNVHNRAHLLNLFLPKMYIQIVCVSGKYNIIRLAKARLVFKKRVSIFYNFNECVLFLCN